ncbi:hypothetical protein B0H13DRAFT_2160117, partial [Mycena leptocephala]
PRACLRASPYWMFCARRVCSALVWFLSSCAVWGGRVGADCGGGMVWTLVRGAFFVVPYPRFVATNADALTRNA